MAATPQYTDEEEQQIQTSSETRPPTPAGVNDSSTVEDLDDNPSGASPDGVPVDDDTDEDPSAQASRRDPTIPLRGDARRRLPEITFGLTESDPASVNSPSYNGPDGLRTTWLHLRPIVAYHIFAWRAGTRGMSISPLV